MKPKSLCMVSATDVKTLKDDAIKREEVGAKAYGLSALPSPWTLPFFVISTEMYAAYSDDIGSIEWEWKPRILEALRSMGFEPNHDIYLRSNMCMEKLENRGKYESYECNVDTIFDKIALFFNGIRKSNIEKNNVPLLIQQCSQVLGRGHISNERRLVKEGRDWKGEIENSDLYTHAIPTDNEFSINLRSWRKEVKVNEADASPLICFSLNDLGRSLELPCAWATNQKHRIHFEWIFNGKQVFIVQADEEQYYGRAPNIEGIKAYEPKGSVFMPKILVKLDVNNADKYKNYSKIVNPSLYNKLGLKTAPIYLLDCEKEIDSLIKGSISQCLRQELNALIENPLVIRTDLNTNEQSLKQMLPRTEDMRNINDVVEWLIQTAKTLDKKQLPFVFIMHNFIPAFSSAFAYAEPNHRSVMVASLWGVPEGLYYYNHDNHIVDTHAIKIEDVNISDISIQKHEVNAKNNFVFPTNEGKWECCRVSPDYIWKKAIPKEAWLKEIAFNTRKIAESIGNSVSVMWFVGVNDKVYGCNVFPWYHEAVSYNYKKNNRSNYKRGTNFIIKLSSDVENLRQIANNGNSEKVKYLFVRPIEECLLRNKDFIEAVGQLAVQLKAVIVLEGSVLSHAYYQLTRTGAIVEAINIFDDTVANVTYDKLVRDKIPDKIESGGEFVEKTILKDSEILGRLKIKLLEEAYEVLASGSDDDLIAELADVLEVVENIVNRKKFLKSHVDSVKFNKKEKAGGFEKGIVLDSTGLRVYAASLQQNNDATEISIAGEHDLTQQNERDSIKKSEGIVEKSDKKERIKHTEIFKNLRIPLHLSQWGTSIHDLNTWPYKYVTLKGKRVNSNMEIEISIVTEEYKQISLEEL